MGWSRSALDPSVMFYPAALLAMGVEGVVGRLRGRPIYRVADTICNLGTALLDQWFVTLAARLVGLELYVLVWSALALHRFSVTSPWTWVLALLSYDFIYYWRHRLFHECNLLWASHVVHHQSEEFNLSVGLRQSWFSRVFALPLNLLLALAGVPPLVFVVASAALNVYQFCLHTRLVGRLGPIEHVMMTPSNHRVHHGVEREYVNRNYGGFFTVWDKLFGTYRQEGVEPTYGVLSPLRSANPVIHYLAPWRDLLVKSQRTPGVRNRVAYLLRPNFQSDTTRWTTTDPVRDFGEDGKHAPPPVLGWRRIFVLAGQFAALIGLSCLLLTRKTLSSGPITAVIVVAATAALFGLGRLVDRRTGRN